MDSLSGLATLSTHTGNLRALMAGFPSSGVWRFGTIYTSSCAYFSCFEISQQWQFALIRPNKCLLCRGQSLGGQLVHISPCVDLERGEASLMYSSTFQGSLSVFAC